MDIAARITLALARIDDPERREGLKSILVEAIPRNLDVEYSKSPLHRACWLVAAAGEQGIFFCPEGFAGSGNDQWGVLEREASSMRSDDCWFRSLDEAFIASGLWSGRLPQGFEFS